jgi:hypothetical protein
MTRQPHRTGIRPAAAAVGATLLAALAVGGCGGDGSSASETDPAGGSTPIPQPTRPSSPQPA